MLWNKRMMILIFFVSTGWVDLWAPVEPTETNGVWYGLHNEVSHKHQLSHISPSTAGELERHQCRISVSLVLGGFRWMFIAVSFVLPPAWDALSFFSENLPSLIFSCVLWDALRWCKQLRPEISAMRQKLIKSDLVFFLKQQSFLLSF